MNVYTISERLKSFILFFSLLPIITFCGLLLIPFISLPSNSGALQFYIFCRSSSYLCYLMPVLIVLSIISGVLLIVNIFERRVIFTRDSIISKNMFSYKRLKFNEIKGFIIKRSIVYIVSNSNKKYISINLSSLNRADNLVRNLEMRFKNLDFNAG